MVSLSGGRVTVIMGAIREVLQQVKRYLIKESLFMIDFRLCYIYIPDFLFPGFDAAI